jgi:hypothetical protein
MAKGLLPTGFGKPNPNPVELGFSLNLNASQ